MLERERGVSESVEECNMVAIWPFIRPNHPNLAFLKWFARNKMTWPFFETAYGQIWLFLVFLDLATLECKHKQQKEEGGRSLIAKLSELN
jgi:hypothetical protein